MDRDKSIPLLAIGIGSIPVNLHMAQPYDLKTKQLKKECINELDLEHKSTSSTLFIEQLFNRYPLLDKIFEIILKYVYCWIMVIDSSFR